MIELTEKHLQRERGVADMAPFVWYDEFYKECYPKLYGLALRNVHNAQLAQDMVQEAFRILFEKRTTGQIQPDDHIDVWLKTVVVYCCRTEMQKMSYHADAPLLDSVTVPGADEELPFVDRLPLGLSESEKKVLQCFYEYRLSHKDIAQLYGISLEASRMKLFRARMHCRELLLKCEKYV